jgi:hypothetical protein
MERLHDGAASGRSSAILAMLSGEGLKSRSVAELTPSLARGVDRVKKAPAPDWMMTEIPLKD